MVREIMEKDYEGLMKLYMQLHNNPYPEKDGEMTKLWDRILADQDHHIIVAEEDGRIVSSCVRDCSKSDSQSAALRAD